MTDINITIIDRLGNKHNVLAPLDMSMNIMELIKSYELADASIGVCGGMAMCASCQCYIESFHKLNDKSDEEEAMLSEAFHIKKSSRLSCQIPITKDLKDLIIRIAPEY
ncbi:2Fe-2S iron-sulfur cluster-binding protein [Flavobacteriaceae bacterium]|nr:2Fe-2S iron-sulfur cluster-binding protein [Flavobacteriaceae bacterium]MDC1492021.1 2Fe-2S iron-sulfur cluster-binding protein [Flavobacteriaceae bacterium]